MLYSAQRDGSRRWFFFPVLAIQNKLTPPTDVAMPICVMPHRCSMICLDRAIQDSMWDTRRVISLEFIDEK
jgi:hypothetical protein